jgi:hypothetical protein
VLLVAQQPSVAADIPPYGLLGRNGLAEELDKLVAHDDLTHSASGLSHNSNFQQVVRSPSVPRCSGPNAQCICSRRL